jgi:hypothetical protein
VKKLCTLRTAVLPGARETLIARVFKLSHDLLSAYEDPPNKKKAGLVGPAFSFAIAGEPIGYEDSPQIPGLRAIYITSAKFSNSNCKTGMAQPDISTLPMASMAAWGDTP